jgi:hypothetical protein
MVSSAVDRLGRETGMAPDRLIDGKTNTLARRSVAIDEYLGSPNRAVR